MVSFSRQPLRLLTLGCATTLALIAPVPISAQAQPSPAELHTQVNKAAEEIEKIVEEYNQVGEQLKATRSAAEALNHRIAPIQAKVDLARQRVGLMASAAYRGAGISPTAILLTSDSPMVFVRQLETLDQFAYGQRQEIEEYEQVKAEFENERVKLDAALQAQVAHEKDLASRKAKIQGELENFKEQMDRAGITTAQVSPLPAPGLPGTAGRVVDFAYGAVGVAYVFGSEGPYGYDCSGLTLAAWRTAGVYLPHNAAMQFNATARISRSQLAPGDLVFSNGLGHVALYVGNGQVIHAPQPGQSVTRTSIDQIGELYGYGRVRS